MSTPGGSGDSNRINLNSNIPSTNKAQDTEPSQTEVEENNAPKRTKIEEQQKLISIPLTQLAHLLECPICLEIPVVVPIFTCKSGHHVCMNCKDRLLRCPTCKAYWNGTRSFGLEDIIQASTLKCTHTGCDVVMLGSDLKVHMQTCQLKPMRCLENNCKGMEFESPQFLNHLINFHGAEEIEASSGDFIKPFYYAGDFYETEDTKWRLGFFRYDQQVFLLNAESYEDYFFFWISFLGLEDKAKNYRYSASLERTEKDNPNKVSQLKMSEIPVISYHTPHLSIQTSGNCLSTTVPVLKRYCTPNEASDDPALTNVFKIIGTLSKIENPTA